MRTETALALAKHALSTGEKATAQTYLAQVVAADPSHGVAWALLALASDSPEEAAAHRANAVAHGYRGPVSLAALLPPGQQVSEQRTGQGRNALEQRHLPVAITLIVVLLLGLILGALLNL